jgi:hypothetical protein
VKRVSIASAIILVLLSLSFWFIFWVARFSADVAVVFPPVDCEKLSTSYGNLLQKYAVEDFEFIQSNPGLQSTGCLQCFCQSELLADKANSKKLYGGEPICGQYLEVMMTVFYWTNSLSYIIAFVNYFLREICIMLINWIGYRTETKRLERTTILTFVVLFFNTAFLLLMVNADLSEQPFSFGLNGGSMSDFNSTWFRQIGNTLIDTMIFTAYFPIIEFLTYYFMRLAFRLLDTSCTLNKYKTKTKSIQDYLDVQCGPIYFMHFKYSSILNIVFVTFMFGFGIPILFPVAAVAFFILYVVEKTSLYYSYKLPPMYDERLSQSVLNYLFAAPLFYLIFGYWMASSQQLQSNEHLSPVDRSGDTPISNHGMGSVFVPQGWESPYWPLLFMSIFVLLINLFGGAFMRAIYACIPFFKIDKLQLDENIDNYWASLDEEDRNWTKKEEVNAREALGGTKILTDDSLERLDEIEQTAGKTLQGVHSYDILANPLYLESFQYVSASQENRCDFIIDDDSDEENDAAQSDLVRASLNLAFIYNGEKFSFDKQALTDVKKNTLGAALLGKLGLNTDEGEAED